MMDLMSLGYSVRKNILVNTDNEADDNNKHHWHWLALVSF